MRKKVIAGNWKMNNNLQETVKLISELKSVTENYDWSSDVIVFPPFTVLETANELLKNSKIGLGAQNMHQETSGAFTGEISGEMLKNIGCEYVLVGHSERRTYFNENDELLNLKVKKALKIALKPILCVGETLAERESNITEKVVEKQIREGLKDLSVSDMNSVIIAYEPVWAIGTGRTATPEQAQAVHYFIRSIIGDIFGADTAEKIIIQYGGSVKAENAKELLSQPDIDGALVGGACLKADSFFGIIKP